MASVQWGKWECWDLLCWRPSGVTLVYERIYSLKEIPVSKRERRPGKTVPQDDLFLSHSLNSLVGFRIIHSDSSAFSSRNNFHYTCKLFLKNRIGCCSNYTWIFMECWMGGSARLNGNLGERLFQLMSEECVTGFRKDLVRDRCTGWTST